MLRIYILIFLLHPSLNKIIDFMLSVSQCKIFIQPVMIPKRQCDCNDANKEEEEEIKKDTVITLRYLDLKG